MRKVLSAVMAAVLMLSLVGCGSASPDKLEKVRVTEVARSVFYAPQYAAVSLGFFEEEGIELELTNGQGADKVMTAVIADQADIGFSGPEAAIYVMKEGKEDHPVVFAQLTKRDGAFIVGRQPDDDFKFEDMRGKHLLGGRKGGVPLMTLEYVIRQQGMDPAKDLYVDSSVQFALMAGAFTGGTGDYVALFEPTASAVELEGKGYVLASVGELSGEIPYTCYYAKQSWLKENADLAQRFTNAIYKGQQWVKEHTAAEVAEAIAPFFPDTDLALLEKVCQRHADIDAFMTTPVMESEPFDRLQTVMEQAGELEGRVEFSDLVDNSFALKAVSSN